MSRKRGFTLIEMLVVISLITMLISILLPSLAKSRKTAQNVIDLSNQRQIINAVIAYAGDSGDRLPMSGRGWPHMGMLDFYEVCLRNYISSDMKLLRCPMENPQLGSIASWWRSWYGAPMTNADHMFQQPGEPGEVPYSYYWYVKMYWAVGPDGVLIGNNKLEQFRITSVRHPSSLIAHRCFLNHGEEPGVFTGIQSAFIDGHAEWVPVSRILHSAAPVYGIYNLDWTRNGIFGRDVQ